VSHTHINLSGHARPERSPAALPPMHRPPARKAARLPVIAPCRRSQTSRLVRPCAPAASPAPGPRQVTHLFRDVLHGWGQLLLCVNVSPAARDYDETARVLRYAAVAAQVGTAARAQPPLRALRRGPPRAPHVLPGGASRGWRAGRHRRRCRAHPGARCMLRALPGGMPMVQAQCESSGAVGSVLLAL